MRVLKLNEPTVNQVLAGFQNTSMLAIPVKPAPTLKMKMKNPTAQVLSHNSNMLIAGLLAIIFNCFETVTGLTSDNGIEGVQNGPSQEVTLWHINYFELKAIDTL